MQELEERAAMHAQATPIFEQVPIGQVEHTAPRRRRAYQRFHATAALERAGQKPQISQDAEA